MNKVKSSISVVLSSTLLLFLTLLSGCQDHGDELDLSMYHYRDTRDLVKFVHDAALIVDKEGLHSLAYFRNNRDLYNTPDHYLYIYDMGGTNIYHAGMQNLEGQDLKNVTDKDGKAIFPLVLAALEDTNNPHAWIHFSWWKPGKFYPVPKSACHFKVTTPDGRELFVGGGLNYPHEETEFIRIIVDHAVTLIEAKGRDALADIENPVSQYNYRDVHTFAFRPDGTILISPVIHDNISPISLLQCSDDVGHKPFVKALTSLKQQESVWEVFMAKNKYQRKLSKKSLYLRKTVLDGEELFVGAVTDLPQPPY